MRCTGNRWSRRIAEWRSLQGAKNHGGTTDRWHKNVCTTRGVVGTQNRTEQNRMQEIREGLLDIVSGLIGQSDDDDDDVDRIAVLI